MPSILLTGAAGIIGRTLREGLRGIHPLLLSDIADLDPAMEGEILRPADLTDFKAVRTAVEGAEVVIHLGGIPDEHDHAHIRAVNIDGTFHVLEAARQAGVQRIVFASSIHAVGGYPRPVLSGPTSPDLLGMDTPPRPDSLYGVSKVYGEALGQMYADRYGLEFVAVRICSFEPQPQDARHLSTWLSPRDAVQLFRRAAEAPLKDNFLTVAGISGNTRRWMRDDGWMQLGYIPQDDAELFATELEGKRGVPGSVAEQVQGGPTASPEYVGLADPKKYPLG
ncbi:NAD(P)-dependent oxidoreductase [Deinococcus sp. Leaf326]|uniref:NAD-dependent epimerase/dehydratase family protein n=1 Tax=Deinococcus sp. Leaf326 TaxID=1736338 RepID=UPI0009E7027B|nr:NAD(P)-dependent oxidoreductase [Deinococcus sp. Leaf326]